LYRGEIDRSDYLVVPYHQYWNGHRVVLQAMAGPLGMVGVRRLAVVGTWLLIVLLFAVSARHFWQRTATPLDAALLAVAISFAGFADLPNRAASLTAAPANILCLSFLLFVGTRQHGLASIGRRNRLALLGAFGALLGYFALFFGTVLIGFVFVLLAAACSRLPDGTPSAARWRLLVESGVAVLVGIVGSLALHAALAAVVFEGAWAAILDQLHHRMTGDPRTTMHPALNPRYIGDHVSLRALVERLDQQVWRLGFGSQTVGRGVAVAALVVGPLLAALRVRRSPDPALWWGLLLCAATVPLWYLVFLEHSITHAGVMVRMLFLGVATALCAAGCSALEAGAAKETSTDPPSRTA
jgi:hypothetical protein